MLHCGAEYDRHHMKDTRMTVTVKRPSPEEVADAFLKPAQPKRLRPLDMPGALDLHIQTPEGTMALARAGTGPAVLLLHGWEGQSSDLAAFVAPLLETGFSVLTMNLPAHGRSAGRRMSIPQAAVALHAVGSAIGPLHAVIAHSMGSAVVVEALSRGLDAERVVLIASPAHYERHARGFAAASGLNAEGVEAMLRLLRNAIGQDVRDISLPRRVPGLAQRALFIHSTDDRTVPIEDSIESAAAWPDAQLHRVEDLGHRQILADPGVVAEAVTFVTAQV